MRHFQALVRIDSTDPPGNETKVAEYVKADSTSNDLFDAIISKDDLVDSVRGIAESDALVGKVDIDG